MFSTFYIKQTISRRFRVFRNAYAASKTSKTAFRRQNFEFENESKLRHCF